MRSSPGTLRSRGWLWVAVLLVSALAACHEDERFRPQHGVDVRHYDVHLRIDQDGSGLRGAAALTIHLGDTLSELRLGLTGLRIDSLRVDGASVEGRQRSNTLTLPGPWPPRTYQVDVHYAGKPSTGYYRDQVGGTTVRFTDNWPTRGRGWLPGVHHPSDPATLRLTLDTPLGPEVVATGSLLRRDTFQTELRTVWSLATPAPPYAFGFAVADFDSKTDTASTGLPLGVYSLPGAASVAPSLPSVARAAEVLSDLLGAYPYANYRAAQVPIAYAGMENATLAFIDPTLAGPAQTTVLVHELAHQWFGNHVVLEDWHDLWLSEGMATFLATYVLEQQDQQNAQARWIDIAHLSRRRKRSLVPLSRPTVTHPDGHLTWVVYEKGASVLNLMRRTVGEAAFETILRETVTRYADQPLSTESFKAVVENVSGLDMDQWFDVWVYRAEVPRLRARWNADDHTLRWFVEGDAGTLGGIAVPLRIQQGREEVTAALPDGQIVLPGDGLPTIQPVGVMVDVQVRPARD